MLYSFLAIGIGAAFGAILRWLLSIGLNSYFSNIPLGTLSANLIGGYLIGIAAAIFTSNPNLPPEWRLFIVTGFLGGLTTFSTFSLEVTSLLQQEKLLWAFSAMGIHVIGSLIMTLLGIATVTFLKSH